MGDGGGGYVGAAAQLIAAGVSAYVTIDQANKNREQAQNAANEQKQQQDAALAQNKQDWDTYNSQVAEQTKLAQEAQDRINQQSEVDKAAIGQDQASRDAYAKKQKSRGGRQSTILTSPLGVPDEAGANKTLLGT